MIVTGAGQISMAIARRVGFGKKHSTPVGDGEPFYMETLRYVEDLKAAEWYEKALDAGYVPDEEDVARLTEILGEHRGQ